MPLSALSPLMQLVLSLNKALNLKPRVGLLRGLRRDLCLCVWSIIDRYLEGFPHLCSVFLLERINRSLPTADHRLATGPETGDSPCPLMLPSSCSFIANAIATAMAAMLSLVGSSPSITLIICSSPLPSLPGNSRVISMIANIKMKSAVMTVAIPTRTNNAPSASRSLMLPTTLLARRGRCK